MNVGDLWMILNGFCEFSKFDEKGLLVEKTRWSGRHECHMSLQALLFAHSVSSHVCSGTRQSSWTPKQVFLRKHGQSLILTANKM